MNNADLSKRIHESLAASGFAGKIVSIEHAGDLQRQIEIARQEGLLDPELFAAYLSTFAFDIGAVLPGARSLIVAAVPQPQIQVGFEHEGGCHRVIIPPTYDGSTDTRVEKLLGEMLRPRDHELKKIRLPEKLLAACSGLAQYGKNNITYVSGMGSFHRPAVFVTDLDCPEDGWAAPAVMEQCDDCSACRNACPTGAIDDDRFVLHAERCLTFHNERRPEFPGWLSPAWHNCLVGCMICQKVCPANRNVVKSVEASVTFQNEETALILRGEPADRLPDETSAKLNILGMMEYYDVLGRNLMALISRPK